MADLAAGSIDSKKSVRRLWLQSTMMKWEGIRVPNESNRRVIGKKSTKNRS